jgi:hypothetical protein
MTSTSISNHQIMKLFLNDDVPKEFYLNILKFFSNADFNYRDVLNWILRSDGQPATSNQNYPDIARTFSLSDRSLSFQKIRNVFVSMFNKSLDKAIKRVNRIYYFSQTHLETLFPDDYSDYDSFLVFGCPLSTDCDIAVSVPNKYVSRGAISPLSNVAMNRLISQLQSLGYANRVNDIILICIDQTKHTIVASSKGGSETQNILISTWQYHPQIMDNTGKIPLMLSIHPMNQIVLNDIDYQSKIIASSKFVFDYAEYICSNYIELIQPLKTKIYIVGHDQFIHGLFEIYHLIVYDPKNVEQHNMNMQKWHDHMKSLVMKMIQIIQMSRRDSIDYVKMNLVRYMHVIYQDLTYDQQNELALGAEWYLMRGKSGEFSDKVFGMLINEFIRLATNFIDLQRFDTQCFTFDQINHSLIENNWLPALTPTLLNTFMISPVNYTDAFCDEWKSVHFDDNINSQFIIKSTDPDKFFDFYSVCNPQTIQIFKNSFIFEDQRSQKWLDMLSHRFVCGTNSASIGTTSFQSSFNLIRGAIVEKMVIEMIKPSHLGLNGFRAINLGFIVESNDVGSKGFAPDMVFISDVDNTNIPELIICEIKTLKTLDHNSDYHRGLDLASRQIRSAKEILKCDDTVLINNRGVILLCAIVDQILQIEDHHKTF